MNRTISTLMTHARRRRGGVAAALAVVAGAAAVSALAGSGTVQPRPRVGGVGGVDPIATVQIRHDLLGLKTDTGVMIDDAQIAGRASVTGKLLSISDEFIVLEMEQDRDVWIPRDNVLLIHIRR